MSYFMIALGSKPDLASLSKVEALPLSDAQEYVQKLVPVLVPGEARPTVWFIHDGETGTSHDFIAASEEQIRRGTEDASSTPLWEIIVACEKARDSFLIWWADRERDLEECTSLESVMDILIKQVNAGDDIRIRYEK